MIPKDDLDKMVQLEKSLSPNRNAIGIYQIHDYHELQVLLSKYAGELLTVYIWKIKINTNQGVGD